MRRWLAAAALAVMLWGAPGHAAADAAAPTDFITHITRIEPATPGFVLSVVGGDAFLRIAVDPGTEVIVLGYDREPYLKIDAAGIVSENVRSFATYYNRSRLGGVSIPDIVDNTAMPIWRPINEGGVWSWHDHRAHWMSKDPPIGLDPGEVLPPQMVPLLVNGYPVSVTVVIALLPGPSPWPFVLGLLTGLVVATFGLIAGPATVTFVAVAGSAVALWIGLAQYLSLPSETDPMVTWWLLPAIALGAASTAIAVYRASSPAVSALVALSGAQLVVWALPRRHGWTAAYVPTNLPMWLDRAVSAAVLVVGATIAVWAVRRLFRGELVPPTGADRPI